MSDHELELICDDQGLAVFGPAAAVEQFLASEGLLSSAVEVPRLSAVVGLGAATTQTGAEIAANSSRWVKLTKESAELVRKHGLRKSSKSGLSTGVVKGPKGQVKTFVEFAKSPGAVLTNPALLAGAAGVMSQVAMQQAMDEITDYLAVIEEKVDDILRAQKDTVLARMIGVGLVLDEAMTLREKRGRVDEVTWSKVQHAPSTIAETQAYALRQLDALAEKLERRTKMSDVAKAAKDTEATVREWLAVLARCFQFQDAVAILELDRVFDASPAEIDGHRLGLQAAREDRLDLISRSTARLLTRLDAVAGTANAKVLLHPTTAPDVVHARNQVGSDIGDFHSRLGLTQGPDDVEARRWTSAVLDMRDQTLALGAGSVNAAARFGSDAVGRTRFATERLSKLVAERTRRRQGDDQDD